MDPALIYLSIGCILWAALLFYVFIVRRANDLGAGGKSSFFVTTTIIIPVIGLVLWNQAQSKERLEELGFALYPGLGASIGVSVGSGDNPTWLYSLSESRHGVLDFYKRPENHVGWRLTSETAESLFFEDDGSRMRLYISNGNAAFLLFRSGGAKPNKAVESNP